MGYIYDQKDMRTEVQQRVAADLIERAKKKSQPADLPDGVDDSAYLKGTKTTTSLMGVWLAIGIAAVVLLIVFIVIKLQH